MIMCCRIQPVGPHDKRGSSGPKPGGQAVGITLLVLGAILIVVLLAIVFRKPERR